VAYEIDHKGTLRVVCRHPLSRRKHVFVDGIDVEEAGDDVSKARQVAVIREGVTGLDYHGDTLDEAFLVVEGLWRVWHWPLENVTRRHCLVKVSSNCKTVSERGPRGACTVVDHALVTVHDEAEGRSATKSDLVLRIRHGREPDVEDSLRLGQVDQVVLLGVELPHLLQDSVRVIYNDEAAHDASKSRTQSGESREMTGRQVGSAERAPPGPRR
jgi:hypothetical protein